MWPMSWARSRRNSPEAKCAAIKATYAGEISEYDTRLLRAGLIQGLLAPVSEERVNLVNADLVAEQRAMVIEERKEEASEVYRSMLTVDLTTAKGKTRVAGTSVVGTVHIVGVDEYSSISGPPTGICSSLKIRISRDSSARWAPSPGRTTSISASWR